MRVNLTYSPGYEYTGLEFVIVAADAPYSNFKFTYQPKSKRDYFHLIKNIHKIRKPDKNKIYRAKLYWYTNKQIIRSKNSLLPLFDSHKNFNQKKFGDLQINIILQKLITFLIILEFKLIIIIDTL